VDGERECIVVTFTSSIVLEWTAEGPGIDTSAAARYMWSCRRLKCS